VEYVSPDAVVGIVANTTNPPAFKAGNTSQKALVSFIKVKLNSGEEVATTDLSSSHFFIIVSGSYSQTEAGTDDVYTVSSGKYYPDESTASPWRTGNLKNNNVNLPAGTVVKFKVSVAKMTTGGNSIEPLGQDDWTVEISSTLTE
jgi:hypothetical protein